MKRFLSSFSILLISIVSIFSSISCEDAPTYEAEITVVNFYNKKIIPGAVVNTSILDKNPTKELHDDIEQSGVTDSEGKTNFNFTHKANIHFTINDPATGMEGQTNIKLIENDKISKKVYVYLP